MAYGHLVVQPARRPSTWGMGGSYDWDGSGTYSMVGMGWNPFKTIGSIVKAVAKPVVSVAKAVLPVAVPVVGSIAATGLSLLSRARQSPDSPQQAMYPGTAYPNTAPIVSTQQGMNFSDILNAVKSELLRTGGAYVASTPEGQAAIQEQMMTQARDRAVATGKSALPWLAAGIPLFLLLTTRKGK